MSWWMTLAAWIAASAPHSSMPRRTASPTLRGAPLRHELRQVGALDELHPDAGAASVCLDAVDAHHVRVLESRQQPALGEEALLPLGIQCQIRPQQLERHLPVQALVPGTVHGREAAAADGLQELEGSPALEGQSLGQRARSRRSWCGVRKSLILSRRLQAMTGDAIGAVHRTA